jgi:alkyl sulfatase BDS1-like metallo-beta-lactamase superfamily hydrolase
VETHRIDGVDIVFMNTPDTEAPAEMIMYYPQFRALNMAELVTHNLHNFLPLRGTQVRNANDWAKDINIALAEYGDKTDVLLAQHHWPTWGQDRVENLLRKQRDLYKYINDQTIRLINHGYPPSEIAETLKLPASLSSEWSERQFYGTVSHDSKAVYQRMLGWYDGNPANLNPLPPVQTGRKFVEYMGGSEAVLERARKDFARGEYRWVAQVTNQLVFADPNNQKARELEADALEQLGYQSESATWRNAYLEAALELRGKTLPARGGGTASPDVVQAMPLDDYFDYLGVRLNGPKAEG